MKRLIEKIKNLFRRKPLLAAPVVRRMCLDPTEMNENQKTDVLIDAVNCPFITLTEFRVGNIWYHDELNYLFTYTSLGFKRIDGEKSDITDFLRNYA